MSVNSKMKAIADNIRALLGISDTMGLDQMSNHLYVGQAYISASYERVAEKGGTVPANQVILNLPDAINSIPTGGGETPNMEVAIITPSAEAQTVYPQEGVDGFYYAYVHGDKDLVPGNIRSGVEVFGVTGTYTGSGGVTVQRKESTFTTDSYGGAIVDCGFQPDVVLFRGFNGQVDGNDYECHPAVVFPEKQGNYSLITTGLYSYHTIIFDIVRNSSGFNVIVFEITETGQSFISNVTFEYVAIKYT